MTILKIDQKTAITHSVSIINAYCRKDLSWIPEYIDDRTIFIGPRAGQFLSGKTDLINAWLPDHPLADFSIRDLSASSVLTSSTSCEVILHYTVAWHKADGTVLTHPQVLQISWFLLTHHVSSGTRSKQKVSYKIAVMHISNPMELDERDLVYNTFGDIGTSTLAASDLSISEKKNTSTWIMIHGTGAVLNRYPSDSIIWIESASKGKKSTVHTRDADIHCSDRVRYFMDTYPGVFLQPSVSYLINPLYIKKISRFQAELWDGRILRIPEKKYTAFRSEFESFFQKRRK